jgi:hypothetical protein
MQLPIQIGKVTISYMFIASFFLASIILLLLAPPQQNADGTALLPADKSIAYFAELAAITTTTTTPTTTTTSIQVPVPTQETRPPATTPPSLEAIPPSGGWCDLVLNYDWPQATAMRICLAESGGNPNAANWTDDHRSWAGCMGSFGLFQLNCGFGQIFDPYENVRVAYGFWKAKGFYPWSTY